jgi:hypothetical protein
VNETKLRELINKLKAQEARIRKDRQELEAQLFTLLAKKRLSSTKTDDDIN